MEPVGQMMQTMAGALVVVVVGAELEDRKVQTTIPAHTQEQTAAAPEKV
jgi:hypothetical protein